MAVAMAGVLLMIGDGFSLGRTSGNMIALISAFTFAIMLVIARRSGKTDVLGGTFLGGSFAILLAAISIILFGNGFAISGQDLALTLFMGALTHRDRHCARHLGDRICTSGRGQPAGVGRKRVWPPLAVDFSG